MSTDRYLRVVLTIIALELAWIGIKDAAPPVSAQAAPTPVVLTGIDLQGEGGYLPVAVVGGFRQIPPGMQQTLQPLVAQIEAERPLRVQPDGPITIASTTPVRVDVAYPVKIEADTPLKVESVPYTPGLRPGE